MSVQLDAILAELTGTVDEAVTAVVLEVHAELVEATPVDTGNARANWIAGIGSDVPGDELPQAAAEGAQSAGLAAILGYRVGQGPARIVNNTAYIERLDAGSSAQAPSGFVRIAIETGVAKARAKGGGS